MNTQGTPKATWPYKLPENTPAETVAEIQKQVELLASRSQYGWGHTIDFGLFTRQGILGDNFLHIAGMLNSWGWWPEQFDGLRVADVGCYSGGLSLYMSARHPQVVYAVDEIPEHLAQCAYLAQVFQQDNIIQPIESTLFLLQEHIPANSIDIILFSGVLYHLSDMLTGLLVMNHLLKPGGTLIIESNAVNDFEHSYANFGRFYAGMWWQPSGLCLQDMCRFMGFTNTDIRFYEEDRCLARATKSIEAIPFRRGLNWKFDSLKDASPRPMDAGVMAPVPKPGIPTAVDE